METSTFRQRAPLKSETVDTSLLAAGLLPSASTTRIFVITSTLSNINLDILGITKSIVSEESIELTG